MNKKSALSKIRELIGEASVMMADGREFDSARANEMAEECYSVVRADLAPVIEAWRAVLAAARTVEGTGLGKVEIPAAAWVPFAKILRDAGLLEEPKP